MSEYILQTKNLSKKFGLMQALIGVSLSLEKGEIMGLIGPNGAGKTTMIKLIMGLLLPTAGSIQIFGKERNNLNRQDWSRIGYVADEPILYDFLTVKDTIDFNKRFYPKWNNDNCRELLQRFHLPLDEPVKNLSRGMKTQLALFLALGQSPDLMILDEPLDGLDPMRRIEFLNLLLEDYMSREETSILISSHYLDELERIADRVAFLHEGRLRRVVTMEQLKVDQKTIRVVFQKNPPDNFFTMEGIKSVRQEGKTSYLVTIEDNFNTIYEAYCNFPHYVLDIYHRNLEDMFFDYSGKGHSDDFK